MARRGRFLVFEGIDGSGTTTQLARCAEWLRGLGELVHTTAEPSTGPIGTMIRQILNGRIVARPGGSASEAVAPDTVALLFAADRLDHVQSEIDPWLARGYHVLCDRYVLSSMAYQGIDVDLRYVRAVNEKAPRPDLTLFLQVDPRIAMDRIEKTRTARDAFENLAFQRKVAAAYERLVGEWSDSPITTLDGEKDPHVVTTNVRRAVEALL